MSKKTFFLASYLFLVILLNAQYNAKDKVIEPKFLFQNFTEGEVYLKNSTIIVVPLNLNTLNQEMLFKRDTAVLMLNMPDQVDSVVVEKRVFIPYGKMFYELMVGTKLKLLVQNKTRWDTQGAVVGYGYSKLAKTTVAPQFSQGGRIVALDPDVKIEYFDDSKYYVLKDNTLLLASELKNYTELFPDMKKQIQSFVKKSKLNLKRNNDKMKLVVYINELLKKQVEIL